MYIPQRPHALIGSQHADISVCFLRMNKLFNQPPLSRHDLRVVRVGRKPYEAVDKFAQADVSSLAVSLLEGLQKSMVDIKYEHILVKRRINPPANLPFNFHLAHVNRGERVSGIDGLNSPWRNGHQQPHEEIPIAPL